MNRILKKIRLRKRDLSNWELIISAITTALAQGLKLLKSLWELLDSREVPDAIAFAEDVVEYIKYSVKPTWEAEELDRRFRIWIKDYFGLVEPPKKE